MLDPPPPAKFFWSVTVYDTRTRELAPNTIDRYLINDRTPGLVRGRNGSVKIGLQAKRPNGNARNWLPVPSGPFYVAIRAQGPKPEIADGRWSPPPIRAVGSRLPTRTSASATTSLSDAKTLFDGPSHNLEQLATRAYVWGMPLVEAAAIRERYLAAPGAMLNRFQHRRQLAGPEMRVGVGPNNDTIYSLAWVDLAQGPLIVTLPDFGQRYYTLSINQADSSAEQSFGQRTHGSKLPPLFLHGPGSAGPVPAGMIDVPVSTRYANLAGRILVRGPQEYDEVHRLQDQFGSVDLEAPIQASQHAPRPLPQTTCRLFCASWERFSKTGSCGPRMKR